jgi:hypothetical protein
MSATTPANLADYLRANSYARVPNASRREEGYEAYKKGYELRIVVKSQMDLKKVKSLLRDVGITPGKAFRKAQQWVLPVYGKDAVSTLLKYKPRARKKQR